MQDIYNRLEVMEVEGKYFHVLKSSIPQKERVRTDKSFATALGALNKLGRPEDKLLLKLLRKMSFIPFELNAKYS